MNCPKCGRICPLDANFCARCGAKLEHDDVIYEPEAQAADQAADQAAGSDARPLSANPVRPERREDSPFVSARPDGVSHEQRKPLFEGYVPAEEEPAQKETQRLSDEPAAADEPTAVYQRPLAARQARGEQSQVRREQSRSEQSQARAAQSRREQKAVTFDDDDFGWEDEPSQAPAKKKSRSSGAEAARPVFSSRRKSTLPPETDDDSYDEEALAHPKKKAPKRKAVPSANKAASGGKTVSHIRPVSQDKPMEDPVFLFEDEEDDEEEDVRAGVGLKILVVITLIALVLFGVYFVKYTDTGRRWQATLGISGVPSDYLELGNYHMERGNFSEAAKDYYSAFRLEQDNYDLAMQVAQGLYEATDYDRAVRLYKYIIDHWQERTEPVEKLLALYKELDRTAEYDELKKQYEDALPAQDTPKAESGGESGGESGVLAAPSVTVPGGSYTSAVQVALSAPAGAQIFYTMDGTEPTAESRLYEGFIVLDESKTYTIRAIAVLNGQVSGELKETYEINIG